MNSETNDTHFRYLQESVKETFQSFNIMEIDRFRFLQGQVTFFGRYLVSMIGFVGELTGLVSLYCSQAMATHITSRMLEIEVTSVNREVRDALGELTNIMVGIFKSKYNNGKTPFLQSIPSVIDGDNFSSNHYDLANNRLVVCEGNPGKVYVQMFLKS